MREDVARGPVDIATKDLRVDLVVSPALIKEGNSDGRNYDTMMVLVKLGVICNIYEGLGLGAQHGTQRQASAKPDQERRH